MRLRKILWWMSCGTIVGGIAFSVPVAFGDEEFDQKCARVINVERKVVCGDQSLLVIVQNICGHAIQISTCVQKIDKTWDCGLERNVQPEQKVGRWICEGTGEYKVRGCGRDNPACNAAPQ
ncbi:MAG: hypothetical protein AB7P69_02130 [Candidatus Binatia bacterium]